MSDFETVALIVIFLVLSAIIVRLIGGDADVAPRTASVSPAPQPISKTPPQPANTRPAAAAPQPTRFEPPMPQPIEPAMVKVELPPPTPIPDVRANQAQAAAARAAPAAPAAPPAAPTPEPVRVTTTPTADIVRPSAAATLSPAPSAHPSAQSTPTAISRAAPQSAPQQATELAPPTPVRAVPRANTAGLGPVTISRPDVKATLAPGASLSAAAPTRLSPPTKQQLSAEDQAIISRYLRPDVKATLFRELPAAAAVQAAAPAERPAAVATARPAPVAAPPAAPSVGPVVVTKPSIAGTLPPGYTPAPAMPKAAPVGPSTGFAPLGVRPDARATMASGAGGSTAASSISQASYAAATGTAAAAASAQPAAGSNEPSPRAVRAASITPSAATTSSAPKVSVQVSTSEATFLSTAKRGTRVIGNEAASGDIIELERPTTARPQTASIWSNTAPRRAVTDSEILDPAIASQPVSIRAERLPVRAETILVRPDASRTIDPSAPRYVSLPRPAPVASLRNEPASGIRANARFTLPPGALGDE